jgi:hypothetical protein
VVLVLGEQHAQYGRCRATGHSEVIGRSVPEP